MSTTSPATLLLLRELQLAELHTVSFFTLEFLAHYGERLRVAVVEFRKNVAPASRSDLEEQIRALKAQLIQQQEVHEPDQRQEKQSKVEEKRVVVEPTAVVNSTKPPAAPPITAAREPTPAPTINSPPEARSPPPKFSPQRTRGGRPNMLNILSGVKDHKLKPASTPAAPREKRESGIALPRENEIAVHSLAPPTPAAAAVNLNEMLNKRFASLKGGNRLSSPQSPDSLGNRGSDSDFEFSPAPAQKIAVQARPFLGDIASFSAGKALKPVTQQHEQLQENVAAGGTGARGVGSKANAPLPPPTANKSLSLAAAIAASAARRGLPQATI